MNFSRLYGMPMRFTSLLNFAFFVSIRAVPTAFLKIASLSFDLDLYFTSLLYYLKLFNFRIFSEFMLNSFCSSSRSVSTLAERGKSDLTISLCLVQAYLLLLVVLGVNMQGDRVLLVSGAMSRQCILYWAALRRMFKLSVGRTLMLF